MKEIIEFDFPSIIIDENGHGKKCVEAILEGPEEIKKLYDLMKESKHLGWYEHRFIFFQTFFNKGCIFKIKDQNKDIDSNIFNLLDKNMIKYMIEHPGEMQTDNAVSFEKHAVKTSSEVVNTFIKGEKFLKSSHSDAINNKKIARQKDRSGNLKNRQDSWEWLEQYYGVIQMMFDNGMSIIIPDGNITENLKNNEMTTAELKQKKRQEMK